MTRPIAPHRLAQVMRDARSTRDPVQDIRDRLNVTPSIPWTEVIVMALVSAFIGFALAVTL